MVALVTACFSMKKGYPNFITAVVLCFSFILTFLMVKKILNEIPYTSFLAEAVTFLIAIVLFKIVFLWKWKEMFPTSRYNKKMNALYILFLFSFFFLGTIISQVEIYIKLGSTQYFYFFNNKRGLSGNFIAVVLIAPICEEVFFRGILFKGFLHWYNKNVSIFLSSLLFALLHISDEENAIAKVIFAFITGIYFALIFSKTNNIKITIYIHMLWNLLNYLLPIILVMSDTYIDSNWGFYFYIFILLVLSSSMAIIGYKYEGSVEDDYGRD